VLKVTIWEGGAGKREGRGGMHLARKGNYFSALIGFRVEYCFLEEGRERSIEKEAFSNLTKSDSWEA